MQTRPTQQERRTVTVSSRFRFPKWVGLATLILCGAFAAAEKAESAVGTPAYTTYNHEAFRSGNPIRSLCLDSLGRLVVAAGDRLVLFDGNGWLDYQSDITSNGQGIEIFTLTLGADSQLYCSSNRGLFQIKFAPNWQYQLLPLIPPDAENKIFDSAIRDGHQIYFSSQNLIARFDVSTRDYEIISPEIHASFSSVTVHEGELYAFETNGTIRRHLSARLWKTLHTHTRKTFTAVVRVAQSWPGQNLLLGRDTNGICHLRESRPEPWSDEINALTNKRVLAIEPVSESYAAVSLDTQGIALVDTQGFVAQILSRKIDNRFGKARHLLHVGDHTLWAASDNTVIRVDFQQPLSDYSLMLPVASSFPRVFWHQQEMYVVSDFKLLRAETFEHGALNGYTRIASEIPQIHNAISTENGILVATGNGLYQLHNDKSIKRVDDSQAYTVLVANSNDPNVIIAAGEKTFELLRLENGQWTPSGLAADAAHTSYNGYSIRPDEFWFEHGTGKVGRVHIANNQLHSQILTIRQGLGDHWINVWKYRDRLIFNGGSEPTFLEWDPETSDFSPTTDPMILALQNAEIGTSRPALDKSGNLWVAGAAPHHIVSPRDDGEFQVSQTPLGNMANQNTLYAIPREDAMWFVGERSIYRYDTRLEKKDHSPSPSYLYAIESLKGEAFYQPLNATATDPELIFPYAQNSLLLHLTSPGLDSLKKHDHEYQIPGYTDTWTATSSPNYIRLENLTEGFYRLNVRVRNGEQSPDQYATLAFSIQPPFYRSPIAYAGYVASSIGLIALIIFAVRKRSEQKNAKLERIVELRTRELEISNSNLQQMVKKAEAATAAKSAFLDNVGHELRTPLNQILGPAHLLLSDDPSPDDQEMLSAIQSAGERMLGMVEKLLTYSENESDEGLPAETMFDIRELSEDLIEKFRPAALKKNLEIHSYVDPKLARFRKGNLVLIQQILDILLDNAIKFTQHGKVGLNIGSAGNSRLRFEVSDTGLGMDTAMQHRIFDPFIQLQPTPKEKLAKYDGSGIGLTICRQHVARLGGQLEMNSNPGQGSVFSLTLALPTLRTIRQKRQTELPQPVL